MYDSIGSVYDNEPSTVRGWFGWEAGEEAWFRQGFVKCEVQADPFPSVLGCDPFPCWEEPVPSTERMPHSDDYQDFVDSEREIQQVLLGIRERAYESVPATLRA